MISCVYFICSLIATWNSHENNHQGLASLNTLGGQASLNTMFVGGQVSLNTLGGQVLLLMLISFD